ncbi:MAG TPA: radical SAM protein, partial [Candidatus Binataceae bacterium]|nr:radical SAM protein [Candidatus Binataceae bacterium]
MPRLKREQSLVSQVDGFQKLRFRTHDDLAIETVIIPLQKAGAVSICLSSQVGCVMDCQFCATARMPRRRNLETWEIVDQFLQARELARASGTRVTGAVFMGMGEPFLNYDRVMAAA